MPSFLEGSLQYFPKVDLDVLILYAWNRFENLYFYFPDNVHAVSIITTVEELQSRDEEGAWCVKHVQDSVNIWLQTPESI